MSWTNLSMTAAVTTAVLVLLSVGSATPDVITGGDIDCGETPAHGSCNLVFSGEHDLAGLSTVELNETVFQSCPGFPNGPRQRIDPPNETPIDYVTLKILTPTAGGDPTTLSAGAVDDQIGTTQLVNLSVFIDGTSTFSNNDATVTINDVSSADSQILDLGGFDFILFLKSQGGGGGQRGTLVCEKNMWYRPGGTGPPIFGLKDFNVGHGVQEITVGWVVGPAGYLSQDDAVDACDLVNDEVVDGDLEQSVNYLVGTYRSTTSDPVSITNVTGCGPFVTVAPEGGPFPVLTAYCDAGEAAGTPALPRPNSCNPDGGTGGLPATTSTGVTESFGTCFWSGTGSPITMPCPPPPT